MSTMVAAVTGALSAGRGMADLCAMRDRLRARIANVNSGPYHPEVGPMDYYGGDVQGAERGSAWEVNVDFVAACVENERQAAVAETLHSELAAIERAVKRAEAGGYGICERCGGTIGAARLDVLPYATKCSRCARLTTREKAASLQEAQSC